MGTSCVACGRESKRAVHMVGNPSIRESSSLSPGEIRVCWLEDGVDTVTTGVQDVGVGVGSSSLDIHTVIDFSNL